MSRSKQSVRSNRRLLHILDTNEIVILTPQTFNSTFLPNDFYWIGLMLNPILIHFLSRRFSVRQPYMAQADWVSNTGSKIFLNMREGIELKQICENLAKVHRRKTQ